jgi:hypothetical protein
MVGNLYAAPIHTKDWDKLIGDSSQEYGYDLVFNSQNQYYLTGYTDGDLSTLTNNNNSGGNDIFLGKYDNDGTMLWQSLQGTTGYDKGISVLVDKNDVIYVVGTTEGSLSTKAGEINQGGYDTFLSKYNSDGTVAWTRQYGTDKDDNVFSSVLSDSIIFTISTIENSSFFDHDIVIMALDKTTGDQKCYLQIDGQSSNDFGYGVATDSDKYVYIAGGSNGELSTESDDNMGQDDIFIGKISFDDSKSVDDACSVEVMRMFGSSQIDFAYDLIVDSDNIYIAGSTQGVIQDGAVAQGGNDILISKISASDLTGDFLSWTTQKGTPKDDRLEAITIDGGGFPYVVGPSKGDMINNAGSRNSTDANQTIYFARLDKEGNITGEDQYGNDKGVTPYSIGADTEDNIFITGWTEGDLDAVSSNGQNDIVVSRYDISCPVGQRLVQGSTDCKVADSVISWDLGKIESGGQLVQGTEGQNPDGGVGLDLDLINCGSDDSQNQGTCS